MTREEAIKHLSEWMDEKMWRCFGTIDREAIGIAVEALQREVPKNPVINFVSDADGSRRLNEVWREDALLCPVCHTYFGEVFDAGYCSKCGQKLIQKRVRVITE